MQSTLSITSARDHLLDAGRWSVLLCLFSVPLNKPATNIFIALALLFALVGPRMRERFNNAIRQPIVLGCLAWLFLLLVAALYAPPGPARWDAFTSYKAFSYPLIVAMLLETRQWRDRGLLAFGLSVTLVLVLSWIQFLSATIQGHEAALLLNDFAPFKNYTQQGIYVLIVGALAFLAAPLAESRAKKFLLWTIFALSFLNVVLVMQSRTSYLIVVPLLLYLAWRTSGGGRMSWRRMAIALVVLAMVSSAALMTPRIQARVDQIRIDMIDYGKQNAATSTGIRLELWKHSATIIAAAPLLGHGLGQWAAQYEARAQDLMANPLFRVIKHPHQEALLILSEQGVLGFAAFILLLVMLLRYLRQLDQSHRDFFTALVLIYVTAGLANCVLVDFSHRHVFLMLLACVPLLDRKSVAGHVYRMEAARS